MKPLRNLSVFALMILILGAAACRERTKTNSDKTMDTVTYAPGSYGYDRIFLDSQKVEVISLSVQGSAAEVLVAPGWQGRVLTSSAAGKEGHSFGWINYKLISSGKQTEHINAYGGEERLWLGPEGGPFSLYFTKGNQQEFTNWFVPKVLDTEAFDVVASNQSSVELTKSFNLENYSGTPLHIKIDRRIRILSKPVMDSMLGLSVPSEAHGVAYQSVNILTNTGNAEWTHSSGMVSIWMLSMMVCSPNVTVFIPFRDGMETRGRSVVKDDYFGKVPADRLKIKDGVIYFKADGKFRSKIGLSWYRAGSLAGSYDASAGTLTILQCKLPETPAEYVNSQWGEQKNPFQGDALNSYNDGPLDDGSQMGPFYEIESSSPAAALKPQESITHEQCIFHFEGSENDLDEICKAVFGLSLSTIKNAL